MSESSESTMFIEWDMDQDFFDLDLLRQQAQIDAVNLAFEHLTVVGIPPTQEQVRKLQNVVMQMRIDRDILGAWENGEVLFVWDSDADDLRIVKNYEVSALDEEAGEESEAVNDRRTFAG